MEHSDIFAFLPLSFFSFSSFLVDPVAPSSTQRKNFNLIPGQIPAINLFYRAYTRCSRGSGHPKRGWSWADLMFPGSRLRTDSERGNKGSGDTRHDEEEHEDREEVAEGEEAKGKWLCCSQVYTANLALMSLPLGSRIPIDLPNNETTPLRATVRSICAVHRYVHDARSHTHARFLCAYIRRSCVRETVLFSSFVLRAPSVM